jgi:predicted RNase H-like HicB family nuclease
MYKYLVILEKANDNYSAYSGEKSRCIATGISRSEVENNIKKAISFRIEGLVEDGLPVPEPTSLAEYVEGKQVNTITQKTSSKEHLLC